MADVLTVEQSRVPDILRRTAPWVRLMSVVLFISCALMMVGGLIFAIALAVGLGGDTSRPAGAAPAMAVGVVYAVMGLINLFPAVFLTRFANRAKAYVASRTVPHLEEALDAQRSYWKFMGIFMIVAFVGVLCIGVVAGIAGFWFARAAAGR
jgi:hypothetical protein